MNTFSAAHIRYLTALHMLCCRRHGAHCVDIARQLGVSKPSVHAMMNTLKDMDIVCKDRYGAVFLTQRGWTLAEQYSAAYDAVKAKIGDWLPQDADRAICMLLAEIPEKELQVLCAEKKKEEQTARPLNKRPKSGKELEYERSYRRRK